MLLGVFDDIESLTDTFHSREYVDILYRMNSILFSVAISLDCWIVTTFDFVNALEVIYGRRNMRA